MFILNIYVYIYTMNTKKIKNIIFYIANVIKTPALVYHELCHLLMCLLTLTKISEISIEKDENFKKNFIYEVQIYTIAKNYNRNMLVSLAPLLGSIIIYILCLYTDSLLLFTYFFFSAKVFMPSKEDYDSIDSFKSDDELLDEMLDELEEYELNNK